MKLFYEYGVIFFNLSPTSIHLHLLQVENCDSNSRLIADENDNGKFRLERVNGLNQYNMARCIAVYNSTLKALIFLMKTLEIKVFFSI